MYLTLCIDAENRDEGVENHSEGTQQKTRPHSTEVRQNNNMNISVQSIQKVFVSLRKKSTKIKVGKHV